MTDLVTITDVKNYAGITTGVNDSILRSMIPGALVAAQNYCNLQFAQTTAVEIRNGNSGQKMLLKNTPITAVTALIVDNQSIPAALTTLACGFVYDNRLLYLRGDYSFCKGFQNVSIAYTGGWTVLPADLNEAIVEMVLTKFNKRDRMDKKSETLAAQTITYDMSDLTAQIKSKLGNYRRWPVT